MKNISIYNGWKDGKKVRFGEKIEERSGNKDKQKVEVNKDNVVRKIITEEEVDE